MSFLVLFTLTIHYGLVLILCIYGAHRIYHAMTSRRLIKTVMEAGEKTEISKDYTPAVTVQIPLYNEKFVVERIIDRICQLDYPCLLYTSPSPRDLSTSRMPSSA